MHFLPLTLLMDWIEIGLVGLFIAAFLSATIIPFSSELLFLAFLSSGFPLLSCVIVASAGNTLGGMSSYGLGRLGNHEKILKYAGVSSNSTRPWDGAAKRYGSVLALLCWTPIFGDIIAVSLGLFKTPFVPVLGFMTVGKTARYAVIAIIHLKLAA
jgi:membrane protein YqaA with SNARE-associated domain